MTEQGPLPGSVLGAAASFDRVTALGAGWGTVDNLRIVEGGCGGEAWR